MTTEQVSFEEAAAAQVQRVFDTLQPGETGYVTNVNGYAISVENIDGHVRMRADLHRTANTMAVSTGETISDIQVGSHAQARAQPNPCTTASVLAAGIFALGAAGVGFLLATGGETIVILGATFTRAAAQQLLALLSGGAAVETIAAAISPYVC